MNEQTLFYYNGTTTGILSSEGSLFTKMSKEMLVLGLRNGISLNEQRDTYKKQLDYIENIYHLECAGGNVSLPALERTCSKCGYSDVEQLTTIWNLNISALLHLKAIPDDNNNGILRFISN